MICITPIMGSTIAKKVKLRGRLRKIKVACFVKKVNNIFNKKGTDLNYLVQGGQLY
jgi:hypothetical protein